MYPSSSWKRLCENVSSLKMKNFLQWIFKHFKLSSFKRLCDISGSKWVLFSSTEDIKDFLDRKLADIWTKQSTIMKSCFETTAVCWFKVNGRTEKWMVHYLDSWTGKRIWKYESVLHESILCLYRPDTALKKCTHFYFKMVQSWFGKTGL